MLIHRCRDDNCNVYACFVDYAKFFARCQHSKMVESLERVGIVAKDMGIISKSYWGQKAVVRIADKYSESVEME